MSAHTRATVVAAALLTGCSTEPIYSVVVDIQPPEFVRSGSTSDAWLEVMRTDSMRTNLYFGADDELELGEMHLGSPELEVEVEVEHGEWLSVPSEEGWTELDPVEGEYHFAVEVKSEGHEDLDIIPGSDIDGSEVSYVIRRKSDGEEVAQGTMFAMFGGHGFHYGDNLALDPGDYEITVEVGVPRIARGEAMADAFMEPVTATWDYSFSEAPDDEVEVGTLESEHYVLSLEVEHAETVYLWQGPDTAPLEVAPEPTDNHHLALGVLNPDESLLTAPTVPYLVIDMLIQNESTEESLWVEMPPMISGHGFHYGTNTALP